MVNEFQLDKPLTDFEYIDGVYYAETQEYTKLGPQEYESKNTIYYSYDAIDWQIDNEMSQYAAKQWQKFSCISRRVSQFYCK